MGTVTVAAGFPLTATHNNSRGGDGSDRQILRTLNGLVDGLQGMLMIQAGDGPVTTGVPSIGTTVTLAATAQVITIGGVPVTVAALTAQALGALGTIPASTWGIIAIDRVAAGTTTFVSGAANYTTGYATEALAIAACPAKTANKARTGYITVLASASTWIAGTDALQGGTGGNPATTTHYWNTFVNGANQGLGYADLLFWSIITNSTSSLISSAVTNPVIRLANDAGIEYQSGIF